MVLGSALAKNDDVGVKQMELVGVKVGAVGLSFICFRGVRGCAVLVGGGDAVSYTHLRAHET